jgi:hypothetical protein
LILIFLPKADASKSQQQSQDSVEHVNLVSEYVYLDEGSKEKEIISLQDIINGCDVVQEVEEDNNDAIVVDIQPQSQLNGQLEEITAQNGAEAYENLVKSLGAEDYIKEMSDEPQIDEIMDSSSNNIIDTTIKFTRNSEGVFQ